MKPHRAVLEGAAIMLLSVYARFASSGDKSSKPMTQPNQALELYTKRIQFTRIIKITYQLFVKKLISLHLLQILSLAISLLPPHNVKASIYIPN